jgi:membrane glycosyltransferase
LFLVPLKNKKPKKLKKIERLLERRAERINLNLSKEKTNSIQMKVISTKMSNYDHSNSKKMKSKNQKKMIVAKNREINQSPITIEMNVQL